MDITKVQIHLIRSEKSIRAYADIIIDDEFIVRGLVVIERDDGVYVVYMPNRRKPDGSFTDIAHPINDKCRQYIEDTVLDEYENVLTKIENSKNGGSNGRSHV